MTVGNAMKIKNISLDKDVWIKNTKYGKLSPNGKAIALVIKTIEGENGVIDKIIDNEEGNFRVVYIKKDFTFELYSKKGIITKKLLHNTLLDNQVEEEIVEEKPKKKYNSYLKYGEQVASICKDIEDTGGTIASVLNKKNDVFVITYKVEEDWIEISGIKGSDELTINILETE
jgi:hypothetical protein